MKYKILFAAIICTAFTSIFAQKNTFYSQYQQDHYVYEHIFKGKTDGVFVDIGAHDGTTFSNTRFFEETMNWTGICVEPLPEIFDKLKESRNCICINGCIFADKKTVPFLKISGYAEMLSGIIENYDPMHLARIQSEIAAYGGKSEVIEIKCFGLTELLSENNITHVDFLSIDTEGGEFAILKSIDYSKIDIDVIEVENNYKEPFEDFLKTVGYKKIAKAGPDEIYRKVIYLK
jgi:FkbM family methyltransferase